MLWFSGSADEAAIGNRVNGGGLLHETVEELSSALGLPTVEPEREFVEVVIEMVVADGTLVGSQEPALEQRGNAVDPRHGLVSWVIGVFHSGDLMKVTQCFDPGVASPAVGVDDRSGLDACSDEPLEVGSGSSVDPLHANATDPGAVLLSGNRNKGFARRSSATNAAPALGFVTTHVGLIDLDPSRQAFPLRADHGSPQLVQPSPCRLVTPKTQDAFEAEGAHTRLLARHPPHRSEPHQKRLAGSLEERTSTR